MLKPSNSLMLPALLMLVLITGCEKEPQCLQDSDCDAAGACSESMCDEGICKTTIIEHCCGNGLCERSLEVNTPPLVEEAEPEEADPVDEESSQSTLLQVEAEDGIQRASAENKCTCPQDCGECGGYISYPEDGETVKADYIKMQCTEFSTCEPTYSKQDQVYTNEFLEKTLNGIVLNIIASYPNPIAANQDSIDIELELIEITDPRILYPITITSSLALEDAIIFGKNMDSYQFDAANDRVEMSIPIMKSGKRPEEDHQINIRHSLEYVYLDEKQVIEDGLLVYDTYGRPVMQTVRDNIVKPSLTIDLKERITVLDINAARPTTPE